MATIGGSKSLYAAQRRFKDDLNAVFVPIANQAAGIILRAAGEDGTIEPRNAQAVSDQITPLVQRVFVGADGKSSYRNTYEPLSPYAALLNKWHAYTVVNIVQSGASTMKRLLRNAPDVQRWLEASIAQEVINPRPFLNYDPMHRFVDERGYTLSQKIWKVEVETRLKIDAMLQDYIRQGTSAIDIARDFEQFLLPGAKGIRTTKPYSSSASYNSLRLARTEISAAHGRATIASAKANPFVSTINWRVSGRHPGQDVCDDNAAGSPYALDAVPDYPAHPQCITPGQLVHALRGDIPIEQIKPGDFVLSHTGKYCRVNAAWSHRYTGNVHVVITDNGMFETTSEHPVLTSNGWINAELLKPGNQVLYAFDDIPFDFGLGISESAPASFEQSPISQHIPFGSMPVFTVALDSDFMLGQGKINNIAPDPVLFGVEDFEQVKCLCHLFFNSGSAAVAHKALHATEPPVFSIMKFHTHALAAIFANDNSLIHHSHAAHQEMRDTGIIPLFGFRDFYSYVRSFGGVVFAPIIPVMPPSGFLHCIAGSLSTCSVITLPGITRTLGYAVGFHTAQLQQIAKCAEGNLQPLAYFGGTGSWEEIQFIQNLSERFTEVSFETKAMPFSNAFLGNAWVEGCSTFNEFATDRANEGLPHNVLLSTSPDIVVGADSGKPVVRQIANLPQAQGYYSRILSIKTVYYEGLVYNMEVEEDNSYTVNGAIVHNCLCVLIQNVTSKPAEVIADLRSMMRDNQPAPLTPLHHRNLLTALLGSYLAQQAFQQFNAA